MFHCSIKPTLKKVSKYENKFAKLQKKVKHSYIQKLCLSPRLDLFSSFSPCFPVSLFTLFIMNQAAEFNFRNQLKTVKKKEFSMDEEEGAGVSLHDDDDDDDDEDYDDDGDDDDEDHNENYDDDTAVSSS